MVCKRCLVYEMAEAESYKSMYHYIEQLEDTIRTEEAIYQSRLLVCKECDSLLNGMCRVCGCFVEMRAAVKTNYCPSIERKW